LSGGNNPRNLNFGTTSPGLTPTPKSINCSRTVDRAHRHRRSRPNGRKKNPTPTCGPAHSLCTLKLIRRRDTKNESRENYVIYSFTTDLRNGKPKICGSSLERATDFPSCVQTGKRAWSYASTPPVRFHGVVPLSVPS
jgi:hypothetical protein